MTTKKPVFKFILTFLIWVWGNSALAQTPYALIGTDQQVQGDDLWPEDATPGLKWHEIMKTWSLDDGFYGAVLVAYNGEVVFEGAYGFANRELGVPNTNETGFRAGFLSSFFTAVLIGKLADEGHFSLDDPIGKYLEILSEDVGRVTIAQLLANASGLEQDIFRFIEKDQFHHFQGFAEILEIANRVKRNSEPGTFSPYGTAAVSLDYNLLGALVEKTAGERFENVLLGRIIQPLSLKNTGFQNEQEKTPRLPSNYQEIIGEIIPIKGPDYSYNRAFGAMYTTPRDFYQLIQWVMRRETGEGVKRAYFIAGGGPYKLGFADGQLTRETGKLPSEELFDYVDTNGWIQGETSALSHFVNEGHVIITLSNFHRATVIYDLRRRWARMAFKLPVGRPFPKAKARLWKIYREKGLRGAMEFYLDEKSRGKAADLPWPDEFMNYSRYLREKGRFKEALDVTELYIVSQPDFYLPYREMGEVYRMMGNTEKTIEYFKMALERDPGNPAWKTDMEAFIAASGG